jgi:hypothetical protein
MQQLINAWTKAKSLCPNKSAARSLKAPGGTPLVKVSKLDIASVNLASESRRTEPLAPGFNALTVGGLEDLGRAVGSAPSAGGVVVWTTQSGMLPSVMMESTHWLSKQDWRSSSTNKAARPSLSCATLLGRDRDPPLNDRKNFKGNCQRIQKRYRRGDTASRAYGRCAAFVREGTDREPPSGALFARSADDRRQRFPARPAARRRQAAEGA